MFLPIVICGLEKLINNNRPTLYVITLSVTVFCNYYIGFMTCIFTFIYFLFYFFCYKKENFLNLFFRYIIYSLIAVGLISFFLLPLYFSLNSISATHDMFPNLLQTEFNIYEFAMNNFPMTHPTVLVSEYLPLPNVSSSSLILLLIPIFFINKYITKREKIMHFLLLLVLFISMFSSVLNFIWHGFHFPNDLPFRQSFIYVFVLCIISYKSIINIKQINGAD